LLPYVQLQGRHRQRPHRQGQRRQTSTKAASTRPQRVAEHVAWRARLRCDAPPIPVVIAAATARLASTTGSDGGPAVAEPALLRLVSPRHAELVTAAWRQITKASSSNAIAKRRLIGGSTASS
jgi:hypothetical protein